MSKFIFNIYLICLLLFNVLCFNLDTSFPIVYEDPYSYLNISSHKASYFGYSVILYPGDNGINPWIQIGAPRGNRTSNTDDPGAIFRCGIKNNCKYFNIGDEVQYQIDYYLNNSWLGGTMDINYETSRTVICAHKWTYESDFYTDYLTAGACYWSNLEEKPMQRLIPLYTPESEYKIHDGYHNIYGYGQAGVSAELTKDGSLILGAPGIYDWTGSNILIKDQKKISLPRNKQKRQADNAPFKYTNIANAKFNYIENIITNFSYEGYSVTSGYFYGNTTLLYVTSAPRSNFIGSIVLFTFSKNTDNAQQVKETKQGTQVGEYFGASITAGDINGDGFDDLIIGAPFYKCKYYNEGKIYIYFGSNKTLQVPDGVKYIIGEAIGGQFGLNVKFVGDLNNDGIGEVVVSAPYELEGSGVIYIYRGTKSGLDSKPYQRIVGKDIFSSIKGFGIGISKPADIDGNGYKDIAIGAYLSGHTILFRSNMIVTTYQKLKPPNLRLSNNASSFVVTECYNIVGKHQTFEEDIEIIRLITVDEKFQRARIDNKTSSEKKITIRWKLVCNNVTITIQENVTNIYSPIEVSLSHKLVTRPQKREITYISNIVKGNDTFCKGCPVHDIYNSKNVSRIPIHFSVGCVDDNVCKSYLNLTSSFDNLMNNTFIIGSREDLILKNTIFNSGENAYKTEIIVTLPEQVNFRKIPSGCEYLAPSIKCPVANPLNNKKEEIVSLELDVKNINTENCGDSLIFNVKVVTDSENESSNSKQNITLKLDRKADLTIIEQSPWKQYIARNSTYEQFNFIQQFQVDKTGVSPIEEVLVEIKFPHILKTPQGNIQFFNVSHSEINSEVKSCQRFISEKLDSVYNEGDHVLTQIASFENFLNENNVTADNTFYINCSSKDIVCSSIMCSTGPYTKDQHTTVLKFQMVFNVTPILDYFSRDQKILLTTEGVIRVTKPANFVHSGNKPDLVMAPILFIGVQKEPLKLWVIILGIIIGFILLLLLIIVLKKAGFFRRKHKEELDGIIKQEEEIMEDADTQEIVDELYDKDPTEDIGEIVDDLRDNDPIEDIKD